MNSSHPSFIVLGGLPGHEQEVGVVCAPVRIMHPGGVAFRVPPFFEVFSVDATNVADLVEGSLLATHLEDTAPPFDTHKRAVKAAPMSHDLRQRCEARARAMSEAYANAPGHKIVGTGLYRDAVRAYFGLRDLYQGEPYLLPAGEGRKEIEADLARGLATDAHARLEADRLAQLRATPFECEPWMLGYAVHDDIDPGEVVSHTRVGRHYYFTSPRCGALDLPKTGGLLATGQVFNVSINDALEAQSRVERSEGSLNAQARAMRAREVCTVHEYSTLKQHSEFIKVGKRVCALLDSLTPLGPHEPDPKQWKGSILYALGVHPEVALALGVRVDASPFRPGELRMRSYDWSAQRLVVPWCFARLARAGFPTTIEVPSLSDGDAVITAMRLWGYDHALLSSTRFTQKTAPGKK